jgi:hypothetical protein
MTQESVVQALTIITGYHSVKATINPVGKDQQVRPALQLHHANAGCLKALFEAGFSLHLVDGIIHVDKY